ncbi:MAG TPA: protein-export chaperone SecB, partial [Rhodospirillales bacterium]|nr:protein-export chaperone SecB [Rhodospirillales bacterium]
MAKKTKTSDDKAATEESGAAPVPAADAPVEESAEAPPIAINAQYIKDLSFEAPGTPGIFAKMKSGAPDVSINVNVNAQPLDSNVFEVQLHIRGECSIGETTAFVTELVYGGVFTLNVPQEHLQAVLLIECPRLLFPFARNIVADATRDGGFPPL